MSECCNEKTECCEPKAVAGEAFDSAKAIAELSINLVKLQTNVNEMGTGIGKEFAGFVNMVMQEFSRMDARIKQLEGAEGMDSSPTPSSDEQLSAPVI